MKRTLIISNSYCDLQGFEKPTLAVVDELLTTHNEIDHEKMYLEKQITWLDRQAKKLEKIKDSSEKMRSIYGITRKKLGFSKKKLKDLIETEFVHHMRGTKFPTGHLNMVRDLLDHMGVSYSQVDERRVPEKKYELTLCKDFHDPRYYQKEAHAAALTAKRGVIESAVGTGKTDMLMRLVQELGVNSLIVVPSKPLMKQLEAQLIEHFGRGNVIRLSAEELSKSKLRKMRKRPIRLINIGSLASAQKKGIIKDLVEDINALYIDEIHHAGSKSYTNLLEALDHVYYRFGFTGTFLRNDSKTLDMWGFLSNVLYRYPAHQAIADGNLTPMKVYIHEIEGKEKRMYQSEYRANYCGGKKKRPEKLLKKIQKIFNKYVENGQQVLILVNRKDQCGKIIHDYLDEIGIENTYISGDSDQTLIEKSIQDFNDKKVKVLIGSQVIGEGIDIRSADHLIMAQGGKSEISIVQAAGRLVRLFLGKKFGHLHDFLFLNTKYMEKHLNARKDILTRNFAPKFIRVS